jgi:hypothetical protein
MDPESPRRSVFIRWSKPRSKHVAQALRSWLPNVIQILDPWMSERDLDAGSRWGNEVARQLKSADFGIVCVTPENQTEPWLQFEAGALGNVLHTIRVCPYCFGMDTAVQFPLATFQTVGADERGTKHLMTAINKSLGSFALGERQLDDTFDLWWPKLSEALSEIPPVEDVPPPKTESNSFRNW